VEWSYFGNSNVRNELLNIFILGVVTWGLSWGMELLWEL
jgi:hypothetical protein